LLGTLDLLEPAERVHVRALIVNRFRGDRSLFNAGVRFLEERAHLPVLGVVPWLDVDLPAEDSLELASISQPRPQAPLEVVVIGLPRISNFDELQHLGRDPSVSLRVVSEAARLGGPDLIILPGSKATVSDLGWLRSTGLAGAVLAAHRRGSAVLGICGGYQMLGQEILDPAAVEGSTADGLGLLPVRTIFEPAKVLARREARALPAVGLLAHAQGFLASGYEIHMGRIERDGAQPAFEADGVAEGAVSADGWVVGTSLHGLLVNTAVRTGVVEALAERRHVTLHPSPPEPTDPYDAVADALEEALDVATLNRVAGLP
jgi:adenosylcobyric acid synthase